MSGRTLLKGPMRLMRLTTKLMMVRICFVWIYLTKKMLMLHCPSMDVLTSGL
jgi:hypothetical protein